jgi:hypothetical protein
MFHFMKKSNKWNNPVYRIKSRLLLASLEKLAFEKLIRQLTDQTPPFGRQTGSIFALLASLTVGSHLFFGSPDKVGRLREFTNNYQSQLFQYFQFGKLQE